MPNAQLINRSDLPKEPNYNSPEEDSSPIKACALTNEENESNQKITKTYFTNLEGQELDKITKEKEIYLAIETENMGGEDVIIDLPEHSGDFKFEGEEWADEKVLKLSVGSDVEKIKLEVIPRLKGSITPKITKNDKKNAGAITKTGNKIKYTNPANNVLTWKEQNPQSIKQSIESALKSKNPGKKVEGKVANHIAKQGKEIEAFGLKVMNTTSNNTAGDIDVMTDSEIIEVKKSFSSFKEGQVDKFTDTSNPNYLNAKNKKAILYIDEPMTERERADIESKMPKNVTLVNSLDELDKNLN